MTFVKPNEIDVSSFIETIETSIVDIEGKLLGEIGFVDVLC